MAFLETSAYGIINRVICPKCKSKKVDLRDVSYVTTTFEYNETTDRYYEGIHTPGDFEATYGNCQDCEHFWKLRNKTSDDVIDFEDYCKE